MPKPLMRNGKEPRSVFTLRALRASGTRVLSRGLWVLFLVATPMLGPAWRAASASVPEGPAAAEHALLTGHVDEAVALLKSALVRNPADGQAHLLLCRAYYAEEFASEAVSQCEAALGTLAGSSAAQDWAGRAFGMQAGHAGPISGMRLAKRVKTAFTTAVSLDSHNRDAINDLAEYLIAAPGIVGGSLDDARALADRVQSTFPEQAHRIRALLAQKAKDDATAEREFRAAVAVAGNPGPWVDLGLFYSHHNAEDRAVDALRNAVAADRNHGPSLMDVASILFDMHREPALAISTLRTYLASGAQSDASPVFRAHVLLGRLLAAGGDKAGARAEFDLALGLASGYAPARKALAGL